MPSFFSYIHTVFTTGRNELFLVKSYEITFECNSHFLGESVTPDCAKYDCSKVKEP